MSDEFLRGEIERVGKDATPEEVDRLRQLEELVMGSRREVGVYAIDWPPRD